MKIKIINQTSNEIDYKIISELFFKINSSKTLAIILVEPNKIRELNLTYRAKDSETDVLSFPSSDMLKDDLGDIFICYDRVVKQANLYNHSIEREFAFLAVHGYLHLLGYTHYDVENEKKMTEKTEEILSLVKLGR